MRFLSIFILGLILKSCFTTHPLIYYEENGECYPTLTNIQQMNDLKTKQGLTTFGMIVIGYHGHKEIHCGMWSLIEFGMK